MSTGFGPGFQSAQSRLYRIEYGAISAAVVAFLVWYPHLGISGWLQVAFWFLFPDLASFIPIGLSPQRKEWPSWGANLYNVFHTIIIFGAAFAALWALFGVPYWPLLGWLGHITVDRTSGYGLRASQTS